MKPYGYVWTSIKDCMETRFTRMYPNEFYKPFDIVPVYTHPAELTDEEIMEVWRTEFDDAYLEESVLPNFARAILKKASEK